MTFIAHQQQPIYKLDDLQDVKGFTNAISGQTYGLRRNRAGIFNPELITRTNINPTGGLEYNSDNELQVKTGSNLEVDSSGIIYFNGDMDNNRVTNLSTPINNTDAATKGYVDSHLNGVIQQKTIETHYSQSTDIDITRLNRYGGMFIARIRGPCTIQLQLNSTVRIEFSNIDIRVNNSVLPLTNITTNELYEDVTITRDPIDLSDWVEVGILVLGSENTSRNDLRFLYLNKFLVSNLDTLTNIPTEHKFRIINPTELDYTIMRLNTEDNILDLTTSDLNNYKLQIIIPESLHNFRINIPNDLQIAMGYTIDLYVSARGLITIAGDTTNPGDKPLIDGERNKTYSFTTPTHIHLVNVAHNSFELIRF